MVGLVEIVRNTKVQIVALIGTISAAAPIAFAWVASSKGVTGGENVAIAWSMVWAYLPAIVAVAALIANAGAVRRTARMASANIAADWRAWRQELSGFGRWRLTAITVAAAAASAALLAALAFNSYGLVETKARYAARLVSHDFRNRQMILARQYMEGYQLHDAARVYDAVRIAYQDDTARQRLTEIERRYRAYGLLSTLGAQDETRAGPTPENAYREATAYLLSPFEPDTNVRLQRYEEAFRSALAAKARMNGRCNSRGGQAKAAARRDLALLVEPELSRIAAEDPLRWYCTVGRSAIDDATLRFRWRVDDIERLLALRRAETSRSVVCPEVITGTDAPDPVTDGSGDLLHADPAGDEAAISAYAQGQYDCPAGGIEPDGLTTRMLRFLVPGTRREP